MPTPQAFVDRTVFSRFDDLENYRGIQDIHTLGRIGSDRAVDTLISLVTMHLTLDRRVTEGDTTDLVSRDNVSNGIDALAETGSPKAIRFLMSLLPTDDKLIRYDDIDEADIRYLCAQAKPTIAEIEAAVNRLPPPFNRDPLLLDNLQGLKTDLTMWNRSQG